MLTMIINRIIGRYNWIFDKKLCICFMLVILYLISYLITYTVLEIHL